MIRQHTKPCKECPFRRIAPAGYLGGNDPKSFAINAANDGHFPCHLTMDDGLERELECAGRATMWANQAKKSRDTSVPRLTPDREGVFSHIGEFTEHHKIKVTPLQLMGLED